MALIPPPEVIEDSSPSKETSRRFPEDQYLRRHRRYPVKVKIGTERFLVVVDTDRDRRERECARTNDEIERKLAGTSGHEYPSQTAAGG